MLQEVFTVLLKPLLKCLSDPMERCRETAISMLFEFIRCVKNPEESLPYLMSCLAQQFGEKDIVEPAEELRLSALQMLTLTVEVCGKHLARYTSEMMNILQRSIVDPFPDVKREGCLCTIRFAKCLPVERPGLGCRELVVRNLGRLVPAITHDVSDWLVATRVRTSQLLSVLLLHAEDHCTQHLQPLLATLYRACMDAEKDVVNNCLAAAKLLGTFVPPAVFLKLMLDHVTCPSSASHPWVPLMVLAAVLGGCHKPLLKPHLEEVTNTLAQPDVCQEYQQVVYLEQLLACVDVLLHQCDSECSSVSLQLLKVLVTVQCLSTEPELTEKVQGLASPQQLYRVHMEQLMDWLCASVNSWSSYSPERLQLHIIVTQSGPVIGEFVSRLMQILLNCLQPEKDPEMKMSILTMMAKVLLEAPHTVDSHGLFQEHSERFLCDILLPDLVWRAGRTAAAVRTAAISCLLALLHGGAITPAQVLCVEEKLSPQVLSALEEDSQMARLLACRSVSTILRLVGSSLHPDALNKIYPELLKRLDDSSEEVRAVALEALGLWMSSLRKDYSPELCASHLQLLFQQLLLHLDDPDSAVQDQVLEILKKASLVHPLLVKTETEAVRDKQRSPLYCDRLLQHIHSVTTQQLAHSTEKHS